MGEDDADDDWGPDSLDNTPSGWGAQDSGAAPMDLAEGYAAGPEPAPDPEPEPESDPYGQLNPPPPVGEGPLVEAPRVPEGGAPPEDATRIDMQNPWNENEMSQAGVLDVASALGGDALEDMAARALVGDEESHAPLYDESAAEVVNPNDATSLTGGEVPVSIYEGESVSESESGASSLGPAFGDSGSDVDWGDGATGIQEGDAAASLEDAWAQPQDEPAPQQGPGIEDAWAGLDESSGAWGATGERSAQGVSSVEVDPRRIIHSEPLEWVLQGTEGFEGDVELLQREIVVGRKPGSGLLVNDPSVSREHARLNRSGSEYVLKDLGSGNGTFVNGERLEGAHTLADGDEVRFGNVSFTCVGPESSRSVGSSGGTFSGWVARAKDGPWLETVGARASDALAWLVARPIVASAMAVGFVVLCTAVVTVVVVQQRGGAYRTPKDTAFQYFVLGRNAFASQEWEQAEKHFSILVGLEPDNEKAQKYLEEIARERLAEQQLEVARAHMAAGRLRSASRAAAGIQSDVYSADAKTLLRSIEVELDSRVAKARALIEAGKLKEADELLQGVTRIEPDRADVKPLLRLLRQKNAPRRPQPVQAARPEPRKTVSKAAGRTKAMNRAVELFLQGKVGRAASHLADADTAPEQEMRKAIERFRKVYEDGSVEHRAKRTASALSLLKAARGLALQVARPPGAIFIEVDKKIADMHYVEGVQHFVRADYPKSFQSLSKADKARPGYRPAERKLAELEKKAEEHYVKAQALKAQDRGRARLEAQKGLEVASRESFIGRKLTTLVKELSR